MKAVCGNEKKVLVPCATRWNSKYDVTCRILKLAAKLADICQSLQLVKFKPAEIEFLREYVKVVESLAKTIDTLQSEKDCFNGLQHLPKTCSSEKQVMQVEREPISAYVCFS